MAAQGVGEGPRIVVNTTDAIGDQTGHRLGILAVPQQVRGDTRKVG